MLGPRRQPGGRHPRRRPLQCHPREEARSPPGTMLCSPATVTTVPLTWELPSAIPQALARPLGQSKQDARAGRGTGFHGLLRHCMGHTVQRPVFQNQLAPPTLRKGQGPSNPSTNQCSLRAAQPLRQRSKQLPSPAAPGNTPPCLPRMCTGSTRTFKPGLSEKTGLFPMPVRLSSWP